MSEVKIVFEQRGGATVASVTGDLSAGTADVFREQFSDWLEHSEHEVRLVVVDLGGVVMMDSSGLGALLGGWRRVSEKGGHLCLACLQERPRLLFEITRANRAFDIYESVEEAIASRA